MTPVVADASPPPPLPPPYQAPLLEDSDESVVSASGGIVVGNVLANALSSAAAVRVARIRVPGIAKPYSPGPTPLTITDPASGQPAGSLVMLANGTYSFTPAPGFVGPVPAVSYDLATPDGRSGTSTLRLSVAEAAVSVESFSQLASSSVTLQLQVAEAELDVAFELPLAVGDPRSERALEDALRLTTSRLLRSDDVVSHFRDGMARWHKHGLVK